eukprot:429222_1
MSLFISLISAFVVNVITSQDDCSPENCCWTVGSHTLNLEPWKADVLSWKNSDYGIEYTPCCNDWIVNGVPVMASQLSDSSGPINLCYWHNGQVHPKLNQSTQHWTFTYKPSDPGCYEGGPIVTHLIWECDSNFPQPHLSFVNWDGKCTYQLFIQSTTACL